VLLTFYYFNVLYITISVIAHNVGDKRIETNLLSMYFYSPGGSIVL